MPRIVINILIVVAFLSSHTSADLSHETATALCTKLGLSPETVTVLGLNYTQTVAAFERLNDSEQIVLLLQQQETQRQSLLSQLDEHKRMIRFLESVSEAQSVEQEIQSLSGQLQTLTQSITALQSQLRSVFIGSSDTTLINRVCQPNGIKGLLPAEFRIIELRDEDCTEIFGALLAEQRALAEDAQLDIDSQLILSRFRNLPAIQAARSNLLYNLDAVRGAFNN